MPNYGCLRPRSGVAKIEIATQEVGMEGLKSKILRAGVFLSAIVLSDLGGGARAQLYDENKVSALCTPTEQFVVVDLFNNVQMIGVLSAQGRAEEALQLTNITGAKARQLSPKCTSAFPQTQAQNNHTRCNAQQITRSQQFNMQVQYPNRPKPCWDF
jgi:hypothetical protein